MEKRLSITRTYLTCFGLLIVAGILLRFVIQSHFSFDTFVDRDLFRSLFPDSNFFSLGAELNGGGRTPGGALQVWLFLVYQLAGRNIEISYYFYCFSYFFVVGVICFGLSRYFVKWVPIVAAVLFSTNYLMIEQYMAFWNPSFAALFSFAAFFFLFPLVLNGNQKSFVAVFAFIFLAIQMHTSNIVLIPIVVLLLLFTRTSVNKKALLGTLGIFLFLYGPFLYSEIHKSAFFSLVQADSPLDFFSYVERWGIVVSNLLGTTVFSITESMQWISRAEFRPKYIQWIIVALTLLPSLGLLNLFCSRKLSLLIKPDAGHSFDAVKFVRLFSIIVLIGLIPILVFSYPNQYLAYRRFLWASPYLITASAIGLSSLIEFSLQSKFLKYFAPFIFVGYSVASLFYTYTSFNQKLSHSEYRFKSELVEISKKEFGFNDYDIQSRIGFIATDTYLKNSAKWKLRSYQSDEGAGLVSLLTEASSKINYKNNFNLCVMAVRDNVNDQEFAERYEGQNIYRFISQVQFMPEVKVAKLIRGKFGVYFSYEPIDSQCISFFKNYYFIPEKKQISEILIQQSGDIQNSINFKFGDDQWLFKKFVDNENYLFHIQLSQERQNLLGKIFISTEELTSFKGIGHFYPYSVSFFKTTLILNNISKLKKVEIPLWSLRPATEDIFAPPFFFNVAAPPAGSYKILLRVFTSDDKYFDQPLTGDLQIN